MDLGVERLELGELLQDGRGAVDVVALRPGSWPACAGTAGQAAQAVALGVGPLRVGLVGEEVAAVELERLRQRCLGVGQSPRGGRRRCPAWRPPRSRRRRSGPGGGRSRSRPGRSTMNDDGARFGRSGSSLSRSEWMKWRTLFSAVGPEPGQSASAISSACTTRLRSQTRYFSTWPGRCWSHFPPSGPSGLSTCIRPKAEILSRGPLIQCGSLRRRRSRASPGRRWSTARPVAQRRRGDPQRAHAAATLRVDPDLGERGARPAAARSARQPVGARAARRHAVEELAAAQRRRRPRALGSSPGRTGCSR